MLSTCGSLLVCIIGCPGKQTAESAAPPAPAIITKADLDVLREEYVQILHPNRAPAVREGPTKELKLVDFREVASKGHPAFHELMKISKSLVESRGALVSGCQEGDRSFSFHYVQGHIHGLVSCQLMSHHASEFSPPSWDIKLTVKEEQRH